jgi:replicative DNA helicase
MRDNGEKYQKVKNTAEIIVAKHRNGPIGTVVLRFDEETTKFDNLALISK